MYELVLNYQGKPCTTSRLVAEKFEKEHRNVLATIREILTTAENSAVLEMFIESSYNNEQNKQQPMYIMNRDGFSLLVMGFTGEKALQFKIDFINAFNKMENLLHAGIDKLTRKDLAKMLYDSEVEKEHLEERNRLQQKELKEAVPKVEYYNEVLQSESLIPTTVIAKELGMSATALNRLLHQRGIIYKSGDTWVLYQEYQDKGYAGTKTYTFTDNFGVEHTSIQLYWTEKGRRFIHGIFKHLKKSA